MDQKEEHKTSLNWEKLARVVFPMLVTIISVATASSLVVEIINPNHTNVSEREKLYAYLDRGVATGRFDEEYLRTGFNHYDRLSDGQLEDYGYTEVIEGYVVHLNNEADSVGSRSYQSVVDLLNRAKEVEPFASLPSEERRLMDNIQVFVQQGDSANAVEQLDELKQVIIARHREYQRIDDQNSWSIPLAILGLGLTTLFGIWGVVSAVRKNKET